MKIKFEVYEDYLSRVITSSNGMECATYYTLEQEYDLADFIENLKKIGDFIERYSKNKDGYL